MLVIVKYPPSREISKRKLELAREGDVVVLIQDGVLYALGDPVIEDLKNRGVKVYALKEDFEARGCRESAAELISYEGFVDLLEEKGEKVMG